MRRTLLLLSTMAFALLLAGGVAAAATFSFSNSSTITINETAEATPYPSTIEVSSVSPASIQDVNLTLKGYSHTHPRDVCVLLVGPQGQNAYVMCRVGGGNPGVTNIDLTFDDEATGLLPDAPTTGSYKPTREEFSTAPLPPPAPNGPYGTDLSVFDDTNPNGTWSLYVFDFAQGDVGQFANGWSLDISTTTADTTPPTVTDTSLTATTQQGAASKTTNVTATFSEPVQNVTSSTFILERKIAVKKAPPKFERVDASVSPDSGEVGVGELATLNPALDLPKGDYRATITTAVTDLANPANALDQDSTRAENQPKVWTFKVEK